ncbi:peptidyl-prolyl cis-trans isomerase [Brevundimonas sp. FT23042]|uniref:peptidylprolyl isomerase n=1 Tax=Brevundimonas sp. FT23042 TaxID=3393749 RepID=UPI003B58A7E3
MLTAFRSFAKSKWAAGLLALLFLGLLITGGSQIRDVFGGFGAKHVVWAGERNIDAATFRADLDREREQAQQRAGRPIDYEELIGNGALAAYLTQEAQKIGFMSWAWNAGVRPGNELVLRQIREVPDFFDPVTGRFDETRYAQLLADNNTTAPVIEERFRDNIVTRHYGSALGAGLRLPRIYGAVLANQATQTRDARWFEVTQAMAGSASAPTDAQLTTFINQNQDELRVPETRQATLVLFDAPNDGRGEITEARIEERFNFRRDALSQPETRSFVSLTVPSKAVADRVAAALRAGQTPEAVAQANNVQPTVSTDRPRSAVTDPAVAAAIFGMTPNQISDPIQARVGFVVAKLTDITPGSPATLDSVRAQIVDELRAEDVRAAVYERVEAYDKARQDGKTMDAAVAEVGARTLALPPIQRDGRSPAQPNFQMPPQLLEAMWRLSANAESEVLPIAQGEYAVVRVDRINPAAVPSLSDAGFRTRLAGAWTARENARLLTNHANALAARVRGGEDIVAVARSAGATLQTGSAISAQDQARGRGVISGVFSTPPGQVFSQQESADTFVIGRTDRIIAPNPTLAAGAAAQFQDRLSGEAMNAFGETAIKAAAESQKAQFSEPRARLALGLPEVAPAAPAQ